MLGVKTPPEGAELTALDEAQIATVYTHTDKTMDKATIKRRSASIVCYQGRNGQGKTLLAVHDIKADLDNGTYVLSTVALLDPEPADTEEEADAAWDSLLTGVKAAAAAADWDASQIDHIRPEDRLRKPHPYFIPLINYNQLLEFRDGVILLDEIQGIADARESLGLPSEIRNIFYQVRRRNNRIVWTTISWTSADKRMREVTNLLIHASARFPKRVPGKIWPQNRLFLYRAYDPTDFQDFNAANQRVHETMRPKALFKAWYRIDGRLSEASKYYDSSANVLSLGASGESGKCLVCGKKRRTETCKGDHDHAAPGLTPEGGTPTP